jgi:dTMP kinase
MKRSSDSSDSSDRIVLDNFVVLEGLDGSGTTTILALLDQKLTEIGIPHLCTSEPTDGPIGVLIRRILRRAVKADPKTVALLFAADRNEHLYQPEKGILAQLEEERLVITDRYLFSSLAYQSLGCGFDFVHRLNQAFPLPRQLLFLNTPIDISQRRLKHRSGSQKELFDTPDIQFNILENYQRAVSYYKKTPMQVHCLDGSDSPEEIIEKCWNILQTLPILTV